VNIVVESFRVTRTLAVNFLNNRIFHNHASDTPINSSGVQITGRVYPGV
jgi:hypothetical protein